MAIPERRLDLPFVEGVTIRPFVPIRPFLPQFTNGGFVLHSQINLSPDQLKPGDKDQVLARLQPGEVVIPVKYVNKVIPFLKKSNIKLPGI